MAIPPAEQIPLIDQAAAESSSNPSKAEEIYRQILDSKARTVITFRTPPLHRDLRAEDEDGLRDQETALVKLGALYRDQG
jgi:hypothetical protein